MFINKYDLAEIYVLILRFVIEPFAKLKHTLIRLY